MNTNDTSPSLLDKLFQRLNKKKTLPISAMGQSNTSSKQNSSDLVSEHIVTHFERQRSNDDSSSSSILDTSDSNLSLNHNRSSDFDSASSSFSHSSSSTNSSLVNTKTTFINKDLSK